MVTEMSLTVFIASPIAQGAVAWARPVPQRWFFVPHHLVFGKRCPQGTV
jgi:hypothetical protein